MLIQGKYFMLEKEEVQDIKMYHKGISILKIIIINIIAKLER